MDYMNMFLLESLVCILSIFNYVPKKNFLKKIGHCGAMLVEEHQRVRACVCVCVGQSCDRGSLLRSSRHWLLFVCEWTYMRTQSHTHTPNKQFQLDFRRSNPLVLPNPVRGKSTRTHSLTGTMCFSFHLPFTVVLYKFICKQIIHACIVCACGSLIEITPSFGPSFYVEPISTST